MTKTVAEIKTQLDAILEDLRWEYDLVGIRFEDKIRIEGEEITDCSRNNIDREDERDFPEFGTKEYTEMEEMDGISTWSLINDTDNTWLWSNTTAVAASAWMGKHAYIVVGNKIGWEQQNGLVDEGELLIADPTVAVVLY